MDSIERLPESYYAKLVYKPESRQVVKRFVLDRQVVYNTSQDSNKNFVSFIHLVDADDYIRLHNMLRNQHLISYQITDGIATLQRIEG